MTLEEFAKRAGVKVISCEPEWGGRFGYTTTDHPNMSICGFRTEKAALRGWLKGTFGEDTAKAVASLLRSKP